MKYLKKASGLLLAGAMTMGSVLVGGNVANAATAYKYQLKLGVTYKYDLDGDKDKDSIKVYESGGKLLLNVNNKIKTLESDYYPECIKYTVRIYDFNKKDKSSEVVVCADSGDSSDTNILKFNNSVCKLDKTYKDAKVSSYNSSNGMVSMLECFAGRYAKFFDAVGSFDCYDRVRIDGFKAYNQYTAYTTKELKNNKYIAAKTMTTYKSPTSNAKAFTLNKGSQVGVYAFYQKGNNRYVKVKNADGKYGYIKAGSSLLFTGESCLWFR